MKLFTGLIAMALVIDQANVLGSAEWLGGVVLVLVGYAIVFHNVRRPAAVPAVASSPDPGVTAPEDAVDA
jgi:hypothetical protein